MNIEILIERHVVAAFALFAGGVYAMAAIRTRRCDTHSSSARVAFAIAAFAIVALVEFGAIEPVIGYSLSVLGMVSVTIVDRLRSARLRRRRVAGLAPRSAIEIVPALWILVALLSSLTLVPYLLDTASRLAAGIALSCVFAMVAVAWYTASAPTQLQSFDPERERIDERMRRIRDTGLACVLATGLIMVFVDFDNFTLERITHNERIVGLITLVVWGVLSLWLSAHMVYMARSKTKARA